jgi:thiol-disulfide isomerase/thioredoxin
MKRIAALLLLVAVAVAAAQVAAAEIGSPFALRGVTLDGQAWDSERQRGKVLMVFYWRSDCAVCLSKMPELRRNAEGWKGKAFELLLVSADAKADEAVRYDNLVAQFQRGPRPLAFWRGAPGFRDDLPGPPGKLPLTLVMDRAGQVVARFEGRVPAEAWNTIADLLP